jgi:ribosomal protein S27AE
MSNTRDRRFCPRCGGQMKIDAAHMRVVCGHCGYTPFDEAEMERKAAETRARAGHPEADITHVGEIHPWAMAAFQTGQDCLRNGDKAGALEAFQKALDSQSDFADAHLWMAKVSDDPAVKRQHLDTVYAANPRNTEAIRMLMVLNGRLTPEQAARSERLADPELRQADGPVKTKTVALECPICQGDLTVDDASGRVECRFCGYRGQSATQRGAGDDSLTAALLERKGQAVRWVIGERLLHCNRCGAERTLPADVFSIRCPFCGSNQVMQKDALKSFDQPDGLLPFSVTREQAEAAIHEQLNTLGQRLVGLVMEHRIKQMTIEGVFLPFWIFDAAADVTQRLKYDDFNVQDYAQFTDGVWNEPVCAVQSPPRLLVAQIDHRYDMSALIPYEPKYLAHHPASLYTMDFDKASLVNGQTGHVAVSKTRKATD